MGEHPNAARVRDGFDAYNRGDFAALRSVLADEILWHVGGDHPLSGDYRGRDAVVNYCAMALESTGGTLKGEPLEILANERHAGVFQRITAERDGKRLDVVLAQALTLDDEGRWTEYWAMADRQDEVDAFWAGTT